MFGKALVILFVTAASSWAADPIPGMEAEVAAGGVSDAITLERAAAFFPRGMAGTPFLPEGPVKVLAKAELSVELRAEYTFHAEFSGDIRITAGDVVAVEAKSDGSKPVDGKIVRLNKGANPIRIEFTAPPNADGFFRVFWSNKETPYNPIPISALSHVPSEALKSAELRRKGRDLFVEFRCAKCHEAGGSIPELAMDAPQFEGIGSRRNAAWMARWILDPNSMRAGVHMPRLLHGPDSEKQAGAIASYLASLKGGTEVKVASGDVPSGKSHFEKLGCAACHLSPDGSEKDPSKISQKQVKAKFVPGALSEFLQKPDAHYSWIRMPNFRLSRPEADDLAAFLDSVSDPADEKGISADEKSFAEGKRLVASAGCLACHALPGQQNGMMAKSLSDLPVARWDSGCLAEKAVEGSKAPRFAFSAEDRTALKAFAATDRASLKRHVPAEFADRQVRHLQCQECHGKLEGFPALDLLGGKLRPEWTEAFIGGAGTNKVRPWLEHRMPVFKPFAAGLAAGLAAHHGLPPRTPSDTAAEGDELSKAGLKLVSANGGFACVSCHSVGDFGATQVFEAPGINLGVSFDRLQKSYFQRWIRSPISIDPTTKMPVYFDEEGKSPLPDVLGGDGPKTIQAIWEYLRAGEKMGRPE